MNRRLNLFGALALLCLLCAASANAALLLPKFTFPNTIAGNIAITGFLMGNTYQVNLTNLDVTPSAVGNPPLWMVGDPRAYDGKDFKVGPGIVDPSPLSIGTPPYTTDSFTLPLAPPYQDPFLIFTGYEKVDISTGSGFTLDFSAPDESLNGTVITRTFDGSGVGQDYAFPGIPLPILPGPVQGDLIMTITGLDAMNPGEMMLSYVDNTAGSVFVQALQLLDFGSETLGVIDGPFFWGEIPPGFVVDSEGDVVGFIEVPPGDIPPGNYHESVPEPQTLALLGLGLAGFAGARKRRSR